MATWEILELQVVVVEGGVVAIEIVEGGEGAEVVVEIGIVAADVSFMVLAKSDQVVDLDLFLMRETEGLQILAAEALAQVQAVRVADILNLQSSKACGFALGL